MFISVKEDEEEYQTIANLIGSEEAGFMEVFEDFVLFQDDHHTRGKMELDPEQSVRPRLPSAASLIARGCITNFSNFTLLSDQPRSLWQSIPSKWRSVQPDVRDNRKDV